MNNDKPVDLSRRHLLKGTAVGTALLGLGGGYLFQPVVQAMEQVLPKVDLRTGTGQWVPTTCQGCTSWCAKQVYIMDGRAIKVRGNPHSKIHDTASCPRQHLGLQMVYDPDRLRTPMMRTNPKKGRDEDPKFVPISWDQAMEMLADRILALRAKNESHKYALLRGRYSLVNDLLYKQMTNLIGSPNNISHSAICAESHKMGPYFQDGNWGYNQYDVSNTKYILSFGADPIASNRQVSHYSSQWGDTLDRAKVVVVDPRLSASAAKAHLWVPVETGQDAALALAIAHEAMVAGLWHKPFVGDFKDGQNRFKAGQEVDAKLFEERHTHGLVSWWNLALKTCSAEWAEGITGIEAQTIKTIAREMGAAAPAVQVWTSRGPTMQVRGSYTSLACHGLNGLFGAIDSQGGLFPYNKAPLNKSFPSAKPYLDAVAQAGVKMEKIDQRGRLGFPALKKGKSGGGVITDNVANAINSADPYNIEVMLAYFNNFVYSAPETQRWEAALSKVDFIAHVTTNISEFSWFSDLLLPANHHMFEKWGVLSAAGNGHSHVSLQRPSIQRLYDTRQDETEVPYLLAKKLAEKGFDAPWRYINEQVLDPETGQPAKNAAEFAEVAVKYVTAPLWHQDASQYGDKLSGWQEFVDKGVWNSKPYVYQARWGKFKTATGRFEFYSETLKKALKGHAEKHQVSVDEVMAASEYSGQGELAYVPHYEAPVRDGDAKAFPLLLVDQKSRLNHEGRSANVTWTHAFNDVNPGDEVGQDTAKINPVDARKLGLKDGDAIRLVSPVGSIDCVAKLWEGVRPGSVAKCFGHGHYAYGRVAAETFGKRPRGGNNNDIIPSRFDRLSGASAYYGHIRIRIEKA
ncbi:arsenate respiratory reductase molybdopterin-containing subunit ArrA [Ferrimonas balearica]|uniref:arsenate respiratory reductase molybdopterin-containing subunit ArrA n=1 Tax=Ferrimonas balearica TaxID=44012 RepID=UPI001C99BDAD|nr:arsenate respiratory reductase molybdopterin-containing subunit ArrA [Ferrimonas balearica]MBY5992206.1 molybdopterin-dependent oxidoreductase [Ferrimonas balearica]